MSEYPGVGFTPFKFIMKSKYFFTKQIKPAQAMEPTKQDIPESNRGRIEIDTTLNNQFIVRHVAANHEKLSVSETLQSKASALKNVVAHMKIYGETSMQVKDKTVNPAVTLIVKDDYSVIQFFKDDE